MNTTLWMKSSCSTCRKAKALLEELGVQAIIRDYWKEPLRAEELQVLLPPDPSPMLGSRSPRFKELGLKERTLSQAEAIELMVQDNNLLKRPILVHSTGVIIGLNETAYRTLKG